MRPESTASADFRVCEVFMCQARMRGDSSSSSPFAGRYRCVRSQQRADRVHPQPKSQELARAYPKISSSWPNENRILVHLYTSPYNKKTQEELRLGTFTIVPLNDILWTSS
jgi:hypothetical protein